MDSGWSSCTSTDLSVASWSSILLVLRGLPLACFDCKKACRRTGHLAVVASTYGGAIAKIDVRPNWMTSNNAFACIWSCSAWWDFRGPLNSWLGPSALPHHPPRARQCRRPPWPLLLKTTAAPQCPVAAGHGTSSLIWSMPSRVFGFSSFTWSRKMWLRNSGTKFARTTDNYESMQERRRRRRRHQAIWMQRPQQRLWLLRRVCDFQRQQSQRFLL